MPKIKKGKSEYCSIGIILIVLSWAIFGYNEIGNWLAIGLLTFGGFLSSRYFPIHEAYKFLTKKELA